MDKFKNFYYKKTLTESPDAIDIVPTHGKSFRIGWADKTKAELISTFLKIGDQWFLSGVNAAEDFEITKKHDITHGDLLHKILGHELAKIKILQKARNFNYEKVAKDIPPQPHTRHERGWLVPPDPLEPPFFNDPVRVKLKKQKEAAKKISEFWNGVIGGSDILKGVYETIKNGNFKAGGNWKNNVFINSLHNEILDNMDPELWKNTGFLDRMKRLKVNNPEDLIKKQSFLTFFTGVLEVEESRPAFHCGRLWLNPKKKSGLFISMWEQDELTPEDKEKIQKELGDILKQKGFKFSQVTWDGEEIEDLSTQHIQAAKLKLPNVQTMDDIKYGPPS